MSDETVIHIGDWCSDPGERLRKYPNGTRFLLQLHTGQVHVCKLSGNMDEDQKWKAVRLTDFRVIRLERLKRAKFILLSTDKEQRINLEAFVRNCRDNWDCDKDAHTHNTQCRACEAEKLIGPRER